MADLDDWGETKGETVYLSDEESAVLGPDGEPLRKSRRGPIGFDLRPSRKNRETLRQSMEEHHDAIKRLADR